MPGGGLQPSPLALAVVQALACEGAGVRLSLPRLAKRLGQSGSVLLRALGPLGEAPMGGQPGLGWVRVGQDEGRWWVELTEAGWRQFGGAA